MQAAALAAEAQGRADAAEAAIMELRALGVTSAQRAPYLPGPMPGEFDDDEFGGMGGQDRKKPLESFTVELVEKASRGEIDPIVGRDVLIGAVIGVAVALVVAYCKEQSLFATAASPAEAQLLGNVGGAVGGVVNGTLGGSLGDLPFEVEGARGRAVAPGDRQMLVESRGAQRVQVKAGVRNFA